jgi:hypothetical protein
MSKQVRWKEPECEVKTISPEPLQMVSTELHFGARHSAQSQSVNLNSDGSRVTVRVCGTDIEVCSNGDQVVLILKTPLGSMEHLLAQMTIGENLDHHLEFEPQEVHTWTVSANDRPRSDRHLFTRFATRSENLVQLRRVPARR